MNIPDIYICSCKTRSGFGRSEEMLVWKKCIGYNIIKESKHSSSIRYTLNCYFNGCIGILILMFIYFVQVDLKRITTWLMHYMHQMIPFKLENGQTE